MFQQISAFVNDFTGAQQYAPKSEKFLLSEIFDLENRNCKFDGKVRDTAHFSFFTGIYTIKVAVQLHHNGKDTEAKVTLSASACDTVVVQLFESPSNELVATEPTWYLTDEDNLHITRQEEGNLQRLMSWLSQNHPAQFLGN